MLTLFRPVTTLTPFRKPVRVCDRFVILFTYMEVMLYTINPIPPNQAKWRHSTRISGAFFPPKLVNIRTIELHSTMEMCFFSIRDRWRCSYENWIGAKELNCKLWKSWLVIVNFAEVEGEDRTGKTLCRSFVTLCKRSCEIQSCLTTKKAIEYF